MNAQQEAARIFHRMLPRCRAMQAEHGQPAAVVLAVYESDDDLAVLRPEDGGRWSAQFHREVMQAVVRLLAVEGLTATLKPLNAAAYFRWLAVEGLSNTPANRAAFIGL